MSNNTESNIPMGTILKDKLGAFTAIPRQIIYAKYLTPEAFRLFSYFRSMPSANSEASTAFPGYRTIREDIGLSFNVIAKSTRELEHHGWITREKRYGGTVVYTLRLGAENPEQYSRNRNTDEADSIPETGAQYSRNRSILRLSVLRMRLIRQKQVALTREPLNPQQ